MSPAEMCWMAAQRPGDVLAAVERRLVDAGGLVELRQLHGLSAQEMDVLLWQEIHAPAADCSSGDPQITDGEVAA